MPDITEQSKAKRRRREASVFPPEKDGRAADAHLQAEARIRESEARLSTVMDNVEDYAIFTADTEGLITSWNNGAHKIFQWTVAEVTGKPLDLIFTPEDIERGIPWLERETAAKNGRALDERFHIRKDGTRFYVSGVMSPLKAADGTVTGFVKIARDMSEKQAAEKALHDREILQRLLTAQEEERARFARDLHDQLGQLLTVLRMKLDNFKSSVNGGEERSRIEELEGIAREVDEGIDFLAWEMRPAALDHMGLVAALERFVKQWSHYSGIDGELIGSTIRKARFAPDVEINLYRLAQEALNNIQKHSKATKVEVMVERRDDSLVLVIEDNGKGFNPNSRTAGKKGQGLTGMRERAQLIGARMEIESARGKGTTIFVSVPAFPVK